VVEGVLYNKTEKKIICYPRSKEDNFYKVPEGTLSIGDAAFAYCNSLTSIELPDSVTIIENWAFYYCNSLVSIELPDSVTTIGYGAFYDCESLTSIELPNSVTSIDYRVFDGCNILTLTVEKDSYAETYVKEQNLNYIYANSESSQQELSTTNRIPFWN
ncbi:MAG: leucine-rich repeat domain-containing protein, partial [Eubacteriales bacterium]|nr:leucine-rich repeat domain-containing protein [Eubacteriales bacterium]